MPHHNHVSSRVNHHSAPLYEGLRSYERRNHISLHVPGHKDGRVFDGQAKEHFSDILKIDATHLKGIDDLHHPQTFIAEAQRMAADAFGADSTYFLVGGSTVGNMAAALTTCRPGDKILVQRSMHKSVFHGLLLAGARPVYVNPSIEAETNTAKMPANRFWEEALQQHPDVKAVWVTNPNYYGMGQKLDFLARLCHQMNIPLLVDEAHGAHFGLTEKVPPSALSQGADLVVQSTHKTLPAMTMASMLHIQGKRISPDRTAQILSMIHSTSPSFPLLASLDTARRYYMTQGQKQLSDTVKRLEQAREKLNHELQTLTIWNGSRGVDYRDPLKWILSSKNRTITGFDLSDLCYEENCSAEISDPQNVCFLFSISESLEHIQSVVDAVKKVDKKIQTLHGSPRTPITQLTLFEREGHVYEPELSLLDAYHAPHKRVDLWTAAGEICGETILPYPPGIPLLTPGERIREEHISTLDALKRMGAYFQKPSDSTLQTVSVLSNDPQV
ncbi:aminotransferase class I/II-fold pyridoxal phosphate-dependent enzyme [Alteribacillus iranensis]|uniref:Arginine/lysine/ornithine decarboxylase n=1 Tax=Alteribacillus iranensis TaxID=930128 RepID=A0A1I2DT07_9BACI|nr:aminotransferase class I/II-fold pyridoxal phosphate-dependent enzyme [Alteribacillus iranensis]SFE83646.1 Arginine/lysine/ornithine decarboxylase [Alteribacillus iranensis]